MKLISPLVEESWDETDASPLRSPCITFANCLPSSTLTFTTHSKGGVEFRGRGIYMAGAVNSMPLLKGGGKASIFRPTFDDLLSSNWSAKIYIKHWVVLHIFTPKKCTVLHRCVPIFSQIFQGWHSRIPITGKGLVHRPTFWELSRLLAEFPQPENDRANCRAEQESPADARVTRDSAVITRWRQFQDGRQPPCWILSNRK